MDYRFESPLGPIGYGWNGECCTAVELDASCATACHDDPVSRWLAGYFNGDIEPLPPLAEGATLFQQQMRTALLEIPVGEVRTYGELAGVLKSSARATGQALGANPLPILIPCHRVIAAEGLGGFSAGLEWKRSLLQFERQCRADSLRKKLITELI